MEPGTQLGHYTVLAAIGKGGMGEVWKARDTKLSREVAIKTLPEEFSRDPDRLMRFEREAKLLASLNHPNIAAIYGLEEYNGIRFLVLELVEGDTLADRLRRGPIPVAESLKLALQIAEALEAAHERGVVHRDLKPANVKVTSDGTVKVLDFGLAKPLQDAANWDVSNSPTLSMTATHAGVILGTAAYMSPEQARGEKVDERTDVFSFGTVLYEMLTGKQLFQGKTASDVLASVLKSPVDWTTLPSDTPVAIRRLLERCLRKDRARRLQTAADIRIEIEDEQFSSAAAKPTAITPSPARRRERLLTGVLAVVALFAVVLAMFLFRPAPTAPEVRLEINTPPTESPLSFALSPDGKQIVFSADSSDGRSRLFLRSLDSVESHPLTGTEGATNPFWSPDGRSVAFYAEAKLKRIDMDGGPAQSLASAVQGSAGSWGHDGTILFGPGGSGNPILRISATGGAPVPVTQVEPSQRNQYSPQYLPDGRHFLYSIATTSSDTTGIYIGDVEGPSTRLLLKLQSAVFSFRYVFPGYLLFMRDGALMAQEFDVDRLELKGTSLVVADHATVFSTSEAGSIAYRNVANPISIRQLEWFDRSGKPIEKVSSPFNALNGGLSLSPNGQRVALSRVSDRNPDIWLLDLDKGLPSRFTFDSAIDQNPLWSPDGSRIVWESPRKGRYDLYVKPATKANTDEVLLATEQLKSPLDWSADGRFILYRNLDPKTGFDIWALPMNGDREPFPVIQTNADEHMAEFSPDAKWIAYQSDESGHFEIYVQPFPGPAGKFQISAMGGTQMRWRRDGRELFYIGLNDQLMAVPIQFGSDGRSLQASAPIPLFTTHVGGALQQNPAALQQYDVSSDGRRFLMSTVVEGPASPITVILNWKPSVN